MARKDEDRSFQAEVRPVQEAMQENSTAVVVEQTHEGDNVLRRSERLRIQEAEREAFRFDEAYGDFKVKLRSVKAGIQEDLPENKLCKFQTEIEESFACVEKSYEVLKKCVPYVVDFKKYQRRIDSAAACCKDMVTHLSHRICEIEVKEFDLDEEIKNLKRLKKPYAASVYSAVTRVSLPLESQGDRMEATWQAELAAKQARLRALEAQESERVRLAELEAEQKRKNLECERAVEEQRRKLELMQVRLEVEEADARYRAISLSNDNASVRSSVEYSERKCTLNPSAVSFAPKGAARGESKVNDQLIGEASLARALANAMDRNRLPVPTPTVFNGNPLDFLSFKKSFKTLIEDKGITAEEKIYYLQQYVTGPAKNAIEGCFYGTTEADYIRAWETLESRYGHPFKIQKAFREKLMCWPKIGPKDGAALQKYADYLKCCCDAMPHVQGLSVLNDCNENQRLAAKLPDWAITRWSRLVTDLLDNTQEYPTFAEFVRFVEREARIICHPVASITGIKGKETSLDQRHPKEDKRKDVRAFVTGMSRSESETSVTHMDKDSVLNVPSAKKVRTEVKCLFCNGDHNLASCTDFGEKESKEKVEFVTAQKLCFGCLRKGHLSRYCRTRHKCMKCKGKHPTVLHDENKLKGLQVKEVKEFIPPVKDETATALTSNEGHASTTNVVPVWVSSSKKPGVEKLVYALLDTQSDSTFINERLCEELLVDTYPVKLKLTAMVGKDSTVHCRRAEGLKVRGYTSAKYIDLPHTYTRDFIPLDRKHIPTRDTALNWEHLSQIASEMPPLLECEVGLLVGYNCSSALAPRQVITGEDCQPFAVRTDLGWSIVGSLATTSAEVTGFCHRVSIKEVPPVTPHDLLIALEADFKDTEADEVSMSQNDLLFLEQMQSGIMHNSKGHLEMPLPFKCRPNLPNNKKLAVARLNHLKKRFDRDPLHKQQYCKFMETMLQNGEAETISENALPGEVNYIPHHGVRHPRKPEKLRVVFNCAAKFKGTSLNDHLLSGLDLTNNLFGVLCRFRRYPVAVMCDIEKMFHMFYVKPQDRDYLRFLWWEGGETDKSPLEYRMNVHLFGATSSPGCANFGLKHLAKQYKSEYPLASSFILNDFYVDDGVTSVENSEAAIQMITESRALCSLGKLRLCKFVSNNRAVIGSIPESERAAELKAVDSSKNNYPIKKKPRTAMEHGE